MKQSDGWKQEPDRIRSNRPQPREDIQLWATARNLKESFLGVQLTSYQEQEIGRAIRDAFNAGRELEKRLSREREAKFDAPWPFL